MATLLAITYPDPQTAHEAMERIDWADFDQQVIVVDSCWIGNDGGEVKVHPRGHPVGFKATLGGSVGLMIGALFALPVVGLAAGAAVGAFAGKREESQLDAAFVSTIKSQVANGGSAVVVLYEDGTAPQRAGKDLAGLGGTIHSTTVSDDELRRMQRVIDEESATGPQPK